MAAKAKKKSAVKKPAAKKMAAQKSAAPKKATALAKPAAKAHAAVNVAQVLTPLDARMLVIPAEAETVTAGGLIIPDSAMQMPVRGTVMAVGRGRRSKKGKLRPLDVTAGDQVLFAEYAGTKLNFSGQKVLILREEDILGIVT